MDAIFKFSDYIFYRAYKFWVEKGDTVPDTKAALSLSLIEFFAILDVMVFIRAVHYYSISSNTKFVAPIIILLCAFNLYHYSKKNRIEKLVDRWRDEDVRKKNINGWLIGGYMIFSTIILIGSGNYYNHIG